MYKVPPKVLTYGYLIRAINVQGVNLEEIPKINDLDICSAFTVYPKVSTYGYLIQAINVQSVNSGGGEFPKLAP